MTMAIASSANFAAVLESTTRSPEIPESADIYGWLIGSWELEVLRYKGVDVSPLKLNGEAHFTRVLEGRAIQDVWIMPRPSDRAADTPKTNNMYGTTVRLWDPAIHAWQIRWMNPATGHYEQQTGRREGNDIVQIGARPDGTPTRWRFTEITPDAFHWTGDALHSDGVTWVVEGEFRATRFQHS